MDFEQAAKIFNEFISCVAYKNLRNFVVRQAYYREGGNLYDGVYLSDYQVTILGEIETSVMAKQLATLGGADQVIKAFQTIMLNQQIESTSRQSAAHALGMLYQFYLRDTVQAARCYRYGALLNGEIAKKLFDNITRSPMDVAAIIFNHTLLQAQTRKMLDNFSIADLSKKYGASVIGLLLDDCFLDDNQKKKILFNTLFDLHDCCSPEKFYAELYARSNSKGESWVAVLNNDLHQMATEQMENLRATAGRYRMRFYIVSPATRSLDDVVAKAANYLAGEVSAPAENNSVRATN